MKYAVYQTEIVAGNPKENRENVKQWIETVAKREQPDTVVLPEMWNTGYALPDLANIADQNAEPTAAFLSNLAEKYNMNIIGGSIANQKGGNIYNTSLVFNRRGELVYQYDKIHLVPMLDEPSYLTGGQQKAAIFELDQVKMGLIICYDLRFPEISRQLALAGAQVLHVVAEWPAARREHWNALQTARAIENQFYVVSSNVVGTYQDTEYAGESMIINPWGTTITAGQQTSIETLTATLDLALVPKIRKEVPVFSSRVPEMYN
ncbi:carbon-nitrogen family hydrolase [Lentibacillus sp. N15]|uniref:carbon-nitrogen family hydrolase n=1 Tax=Lentibacillus songyuanensis TaxID=3136161 RepID=UPI0031BA5868